MALSRAIYISRRINPDDDQELQDILDKSRENNAVSHITGLLLVSGEYFLQVLEGRITCVSQTLEKVYRDPRHTDVRLVLFHEVSSLLFAKWSMAQLEIRTPVIEDPLCRELIESFINTDPKSELLIDRRAVESLLIAFMRDSESNRYLALYL